MEAYYCLLLYFVALALLFPANISSGINLAANKQDIIGAILDCSTRLGKEERVAMEIAVEDLNNRQNFTRLFLRVKCSGGEPVRAAQAARHLMNKIHVRAILGPNSWAESFAVAEVGRQSDVPILSLSDFTPPWAIRRWPFFIQASSSISDQMKAVADIIQSWRCQSWGWHRVNVIYEDTDSAANDILNHLYGAFQDADVQMSAVVALPSFISFDKLHEELEKLKEGPFKVFVVHANLALAERLFKKAKEMKMVERGYIWITMDSTTSLVHSMNASVISSMQGVLGVRRYFSDMGQDFHNFNVKFVESFRQKYPEEKNQEPGIFALQAYDATRAVGSAIIAGGKNGLQILEKIEEMEFDGLSGKIQFTDRTLAPIKQFQIINVVGKSYQELGFWSDGLGFSTDIDIKAVHNFSMKSLGQVVWPGRPWSTPRGWDLPPISNPLRIGVPNGSLTNKFVKVEYNPSTKNYTFSGFSIEVFKKTVKHLKYYLPYQFIPFGGNYTDLVKQVQLKKFDAAVGDIAIISKRYDYVEFTHAHTEQGVVMVVPIQSHPNRAWLFMKPFTKAMWLLTAFINVYNGFVVWSIERNYSEVKGPLISQIGTPIWLAFNTLFSTTGGRLHSNLSKMATLVWLFVAIIITQSYTANLASMLTTQRIEPKITNIETLKSESAFIGYSQVSFVRNYLEQALKFNSTNLKSYTTTEAYAEAFRSGEISAAFLEVPVAKLFVAKYCKSFTIAPPTYKVGGYGFALPKGSLLLPDLDEALLRVFESGALKELQNNLIASEKCLDKQADNDTASLSPQSFFVLFILTGGTSSAALAIFYFQRKWTVDGSMAEHRRIWMLILMVLRKWRDQKNRFSRKVSDIERPRDSPNSSPYNDESESRFS